MQLFAFTIVNSRPTNVIIIYNVNCYIGVSYEIVDIGTIYIMESGLIN